MNEIENKKKTGFENNNRRREEKKNVHTNANDTSRKKRLPFKFEQFFPLSKRSAARGKKSTGVRA